MWSRVRVSVKPAGRPVSVADVRLRLRLDDDGDDADIERMIDGAVARIEGPRGWGIALLSQTWTLSLDCFPCGGFSLPGWPVQQVSAIRYVDGQGAQQTLTSDDWQLATGLDPVHLAPAYNTAWPGTRDQAGAVEIDYEIGRPLADLDADLIDAVLLLVGHRYEHREPVLTGLNAAPLPLAYEAIRNEYHRGAGG